MLIGDMREGWEDMLIGDMREGWEDMLRKGQM